MLQGGNIKGATNYPSNTFIDNVNDIINLHSEYPNIVFHCALSQSRGPKAARIYNEIKNNLNRDSDQNVYILTGGCTHFQSLYSNDETLIENFNPSIWNK